jgi:hypothetical protein
VSRLNRQPFQGPFGQPTPILLGRGRLMLLPRAMLLALTADHPPPAQTTTAARGGGEYWLGHCEGFKVQSPEGDVGIVESVVYATDAARPAYLAVTGGRLLLHTALVPCTEVISIDARQTRLGVQARPARQSLGTTMANGARWMSHRPPARRARWKGTR